VAVMAVAAAVAAADAIVVNVSALTTMVSVATGASVVV
jgi:hypothetical protein